MRDTSSMSGVLCLFPTSDELTSTSTLYLMLLPLASNHTYLATCTRITRKDMNLDAILLSLLLPFSCLTSYLLISR